MSAYYNENDPWAAAWLRELIKARLIPAGDVDERPIEEVRPHELAGYTQCHFFAGIGGWAYALQLAGWPADRPVWTGSCPCQPYSNAGKRLADDDPRNLWPEFRRLIAERQPPVVLGEQVASKAGRHWLARVRADLEALGYAVGGADLCAAGVGAPHIRQRLWWAADAGRRGNERWGKLGETRGTPRAAQGETRERERRGADAGGRGSCSGVSDTGGARSQAPERAEFSRPGRREEGRAATQFCGPQDAWATESWIPCADGKTRRIEPGLEPLVDGLPGRVGLLRGYGNAIVPQVAAQFIQAYREARDLTDLLG